MKVNETLVICVALIVGSNRAAAEARKILVQSPLDRFELVLKPGADTVEGKPADLTGHREMLTVLLGEITGACPDLKGAPDLTLREGEKQHDVFLKAGVVREGKNCLSVGGEDLYRAPVHRDFLIGPREEHLVIGPDLTLIDGERTIAKLRQEGTDWASADGATLPNEDFFRRFGERLATFPVRQRLSAVASVGKRHVVIKTGGKSYDAFKVTDGAWAVQKPGAKWLLVSDDWSFWYDLDAHTLEDSYAEQIRTAGDATKDVDERLSQAKRLETTWSANVRGLYRRLLLEPNVDQRLVEIAIRRLKTKPSRETAAVLVDVLENTPSEETQRRVVPLLRLQNPAGPKLGPGATPADRRRVIDFWRNWIKKAAR